MKKVALGALLCALTWPSLADDSALAKASQNPVANMISIPVENNAYFDVGPSGERAYISNIKPVYPVPVTEHLNLINRVVAPLIYLESQDEVDFATDPGHNLGGIGVFPGFDSEFGLGNTQYQAFFSPASPGKLIWGVGPVFRVAYQYRCQAGHRHLVGGSHRGDPQYAR